ncbi:MAG: hemerythrin domain-containing protein [bacterium]|nr:hemerythrin domain-containing protein [bacterium]
MSVLVDNILNQHHEYLRNTLPHLGEMAEKVHNVHGENHPELLDILQTFAGIFHELDSHMYKEENILFPAIKRLEQGSMPPLRLHSSLARSASWRRSTPPLEPNSKSFVA